MRPLASFLLLTALAWGQNAPGPGRALGPVMARVHVEIFSDFQCPYCKVFYEHTERPLIENYAKTGKIYLEQRMYPLTNLHPPAKQAACYACAAERVGKYEQVCDVLFRDQEKWAKTGDVDQTVCSVLNASEAKKVRALVSDPAVVAEVENDMALGMSRKIDGTPTIFVEHDGRTESVPYNVSYPILARYLDSLVR